MGLNDRKSPLLGEGQHPRDGGPNAAGHLRELIAAVDARIPQLERAGEVDIARDAATLRREAVARLAELERTSPRQSP